MTYDFGFIGCGNMGGAIADAVARAVPSERLVCADFFEEKTDRLKNTYGFAVSDTWGIARDAKYIFLGVKPQMMAETLASVADMLRDRSDRFVLVTMAAGIKCDKICEFAGGDYPVIRIMPNTPVSVGEGTVLLCANENVTEEEIFEFKTAMAHAGVIDELPEKLIDAACAVSGCGPAFVALMIEALADGGVECGLPRDKALLYAAQTFKGTAALLLEKGMHPGVLKDGVCSPGGTTILGVHELENRGVRGAVMNAVSAAYKKSVEMGK